MTDTYIDQKFIEAISELVDTIMLTSETDFDHGPMSYETAKMLVIQQMIPLVVNLLNDESTTSAEKFVSVTAALSHITVENFFLQSEILKIQHPNDSVDY